MNLFTINTQPHLILLQLGNLFFKKWVSVTFFLFLALISNAQEFHWVASSNNNWNNPSNWSATAGGAGGAGVPSSETIVYFDWGSAANCTVDAPVDIASITVSSAYSGIISQGGSSITVNKTANFSGGAFLGGSADITFKSDFVLSGSIFTSTSGVLELQSNSSFNGGIFNHNNGTLKFNCINSANPYPNISGSAPTLFNMEVVGVGKRLDLWTSGSITVLNNLKNSGSSSIKLSTGSIDLKGDLTLNNTNTDCGGTATININGSGTQTINGSAASMQGMLPKVMVSKPSGTLNLTNFVSIANDFYFNSGTLNPGTSTLVFSFTDAYLTIHSSAGSLNLNNLRFENRQAGWVTTTITDGTGLNVNGNFEIAGTANVVINTGTISVKGNIHLSNTASDGGGTATVILNGTADQTISGSGIALFQSKLPNVKINKPSGSVYLDGNVSFNGNFNLVAGTVVPGTASVALAPEGDCTFDGSTSFYNFSFKPKWNGSIYIPSSTTITILNDFVIDGLYNASLYNGTIVVKGNIYNNCQGTNDWGDATIIINGTADQAIICNGEINKAKLPGITINKASGILTLPNILNISGAWNYFQGNLDVLTHNSTLVFAANNTITGSHTLNNVTFLGPGNSNYVYNLGQNTVLTLLGSLTFDGVGNLNLQNGEIHLYKNLNFANTGEAGMGSTVVKFLGTEDQHITSNLSSQQTKLPSVIIDKPSGKLVLPATTTVYGNWNYVSGEIDASTNNSTVVFSGRLNLTGNPHELNNVTFSGGNDAVYMLDTGLITVNGLLTVGSSAGGVIIESNHGDAAVINAKGNVLVGNSYLGGGGNGVIRINGDGNQTLTGNQTPGTGNLSAILIDKPSGTLTLSQVISIYGSWTHQRGVVNASGSTLVFSINPSVITSNGMQFNNIIHHSGFLSLEDDITILGDLTLLDGSFYSQNKKITIYGNWSSSATNTFFEGAGLVDFAASGLQTILCPQGAKFHSVRISGGGIKTLLSNIAIGNELSFVSGKIATGSNKVVIEPTGNITGAGAGGYVQGYLQKYFSNGSNISNAFELGNSAGYSPATLTFPVISSAGNVTVKSIEGKHPQLAVSGLDSLKTVSNYWSIASSDISPVNYNLTVDFDSAVKDAATNMSGVIAGIYNGSTWAGKVISNSSTTSVNVTGMTVFGDVQFAEKATTTISITSDAEAEVCYGTSVTLTAHTTYPGPSPVYQWKVNGVSAGSNSSSFSSSTLTGENVITCTISSNLPLANGDPASSNEISFIVVAGKWIGAEDGDWNNPLNWCGGVPISTIDVTINPGAANSPVISGSAECRNLVIESGADLTLSYGSIAISGNLTNNGTFEAAGQVLFNGASAQSVNGSGTNNFAEVEFLGSGVKNLSSPVSISKVATIADGVAVNSNGNLTLLSTASSSASIAALKNGAVVNGIVNVQSYISGGDLKYRSTRVLSSPVIDAQLPGNNTFKQLQSSMIITGPGGVSNGFDVGGTYGPDGATLLKYDEPATLSQSQYTKVGSINEQVSPGQGFFLYYRGNRSNYSSKVNAPYALPESVIMTYKGPINQGNVPVNLSYTNNPDETAYNGYNLIGNPYPAVIDWEKVEKLHVGEELKFIKPSGGFATYSGGFSINSDNESLQYIQPGQGFYVRAASNGASVTFTEDAKAVGDSPVRLLYKGNEKLSFAAALPGSGANIKSTIVKKQLRMNVQDGANTEEALLLFQPGRSSAATMEDATFFGGSTVSLSTLSSDGVKLGINFMPEISSVKEVGIFVDGSTASNLKINFTDLSAAENYSVFLKDNYLNKVVDVRQNPSYPFSINKTNSATFGTKRFSVLFIPQSTLDINWVSAKVKRTNAGSLLSWTVASLSEGVFEIERATENLDFKKIGGMEVVSAKQSFSFTDKSPSAGVNYYRIKYDDKQGKVTYSELLALNEGDEDFRFSVFPNPTSDKITIQMPERNSVITLKLISLAGKVVSSKDIALNQPLENSMKDLQPGVYLLQITNKNTSSVLRTIKVIKN